MGQCVSRKAAGAFAASAAATHKRSTTMHKSNTNKESPDYDDNKDNGTKKTISNSKGVAMSFGFKRRPVTAPSIADNATAARRLAKHEVIDKNGNGDTEPLTSNAIPPGRTTPRLAPPRKEANATRVSRFGFRQPNTNKYNKISDVNTAQPTHFEYKNNNRSNYKSATSLQPRVKSATTTIDTHENKTSRYGYMPSQINRFTLQSSQLPKPQLPVRLMETKTAKTWANNNKKASHTLHPPDDNSSKEGSVTEDSGVGSHSSTGNGETDTLKGIELLDSSPIVNNQKNLQQKSRQFEMITSGKHFDLRDLDDSSEPIVPLPSLPSAFQNNINTGFVRERKLEYEKNLDKIRRKISITSSEGYSDEYAGEDKAEKNKCNSLNSHPKTFLKSKSKINGNSSPPSSDDHEWMHAGEAMADDFSCSFSSSDESKEKESLLSTNSVIKPATLALQNIMNSTNIKSLSPSNREFKNVLLTIEDPKFAAVAAASNTSTLLDDETSPVDSLICSYSESEDYIKHKLLDNNNKKHSTSSSSNSKDINEKLTLSPSSPGTPTNASNSLSLSDGKDYFDDEIADQPSLVFDDTLTGAATEPLSTAQQNSENTPTLIESTPKPKRKLLGAFEGSPLLLRKKSLLLSRTASVDTLSPCESITSDDLMLDYEQSQSSGLEDPLEKNDLRNNDFGSNDDSEVKINETKVADQLREWAVSVTNQSNKESSRSITRTSRLLRSRASTPSSISDSPCSLDSRLNSKVIRAITRSPLRPPRPPLGSPAGYESDESIKIDRASHGAIVQDIVQMKTMLIKLKRVLNESETLNPFENQQSLKNGLFNGFSSEDTSTENISLDDTGNSRLEMADLRRQVLFLQGQLEDREQSLHILQEKMNKLIIDTEGAKSAPASTISSEISTANAATQTDRVRPISAGPSLLQVSPTDSGMGSLVSASENSRKVHPTSVDTSSSQYCNSNSQKLLPKLWRKPGEPPSSPKYGSNIQSSSIPRRANSRTRAPSTPS